MPRSQLIEDIVALAETPAPTFSEEERIRWIQRRLAQSTGRCWRDETGNLLWAWGEAKPAVLLAAHFDTVFPAGTPLKVEYRDGRLAVPGVGVYAAAIAVAISVVEGLLRRRKLASGAVAFTVGEEGLGNLRGAISACAALQPDAVVALEGHGLDQVVVDAVGSVRARVRIEGPGGHPWVDRGRPSAVHALLGLGAALTRRSSAAAPVNVGVVSGGRSVNTVADRAEFLVEMRATDESRLDAFVATLARLEVPPPLEIAADVIGRRPAGRLRRVCVARRPPTVGVADVAGDLRDELRGQRRRHRKRRLDRRNPATPSFRLPHGYAVSPRVRASARAPRAAAPRSRAADVQRGVSALSRRRTRHDPAAVREVVGGLRPDQPQELLDLALTRIESELVSRLRRRRCRHSAVVATASDHSPDASAFRIESESTEGQVRIPVGGTGGWLTTLGGGTG